MAKQLVDTSDNKNTPNAGLTRPPVQNPIGSDVNGLGQTLAPISANVPGASLMNTPQLANMFNVTYDENAIRKKFDDATTAEYRRKDEEYRNTQNAFSQQMGAMNDSQADAIRRSMAQGMASGTDSSAAIVSSMLQNQQAHAQGATDLMNQRNLLKAQEAEAYTKNASTALETANGLGMQFGNLASQLYGLDIQDRAGLMQYFASLDSSNKQLWSSKYASDLNRTNELNRIRQSQGNKTDPGGW